MYENELMHYGVKGMKWGHRKKYRNSDGSLNAAGEKRASKEYKKYSVKLTKDLAKNQNNRRINAYNKAADDMNNGMIDKYNKAYNKKLGAKAKNHDYANDYEYARGYEKMFSKQMSKYYNQLTVQEMKSNKNYKKAQKLCDEFNMTSFDDLAKSNAESIREMSKYLD